MKKTLLIVISLILASLLLVVACDDKSGSVDPENPSIVIPVVPEGAPSLDEDDLKEITEEPVEPKDEDILLISTLAEELQKFVAVPDEGGKGSDLSEEAWEIVYDLLNAVGEQGIELKGEGYSLAATFDFEKQSLTASGSFNKFVFDKFTFDGSVLFTVSPNEDYNPFDGSERFTITSDEKTNLTITIGEEKTTYKDVEAVVSGIMGSLSEADMKSLIDAANKTIPGLVEAANNFIKNYTIKTDFLTLILNGNVKGLVTLSDSGFDFGEGVEVSANGSAYTNKPIDFNGSQYKVFVSGNADATIDNNPEYDPDYEGEYDPAKYAPLAIKFEGSVNLVLETSGTIGSQKVRFQANVSGSNLEGEPKVQVYAVINDRVIDINALIENAE